jgi:hypothetical protein
LSDYLTQNKDKYFSGSLSHCVEKSVSTGSIRNRVAQKGSAGGRTAVKLQSLVAYCMKQSPSSEADVQENIAITNTNFNQIYTASLT